MRGKGGERGLSLVEATIILAVLSALTAALAPAMMASLDDARETKAREDVAVLASALESMLNDTGETFFLRDGNGATPTDPPSRAATNRVHMLVGNGENPFVDPAVVRAVGTDWDDPLDSVTVWSFYSQLITNTPGYRSPAQMTVVLQFDPDSGSGSNNEFGWRGGYLAPIVGPDPWGRRYAANVEFLGRNSGSSTPTGSDNDVMVLSAGPDGRVDTPFAASPTTLGFDDLMVTVSGSVR